MEDIDILIDELLVKKESLTICYELRCGKCEHRCPTRNCYKRWVEMRKEQIETRDKIKSKDNSLVHNPSHYNREGRKSCWDEMIEQFGSNATVIFDVMNAYKYYYRAGAKADNPKEQDLEKIKEYMNHSRELINNNPTELWALDTYAHMVAILNSEEKNG